MTLRGPIGYGILCLVCPGLLWATPAVHLPNTPCPNSCQLRITSYKNGVEVNPNVYRIEGVTLTSSKEQARAYQLYNPDSEELRRCLDKIDTLAEGKAVYVEGAEYHLIDAGLDVFRFNDECSVGPAEPGKVKGIVVGTPDSQKKKKASKRRYFRGKFKPQSIRKND